MEAIQGIAEKIEQGKEAGSVQNSENRKSTLYLRYLKENDMGHPLYHRLILI